MATKAKATVQGGKRGTCDRRGCERVIFLKPNRAEVDKEGQLTGRFLCPEHLKRAAHDGPIPKAETLKAWDEAEVLSARTARRATTAVRKAEVDPAALRGVRTLADLKAVLPDFDTDPDEGDEA